MPIELLWGLFGPTSVEFSIEFWREKRLFFVVCNRASHTRAGARDRVCRRRVPRWQTLQRALTRATMHCEFRVAVVLFDNNTTATLTVLVSVVECYHNTFDDCGRNKKKVNKVWSVELAALVGGVNMRAGCLFHSYVRVWCRVRGGGNFTIHLNEHCAVSTPMYS